MALVSIAIMLACAACHGGGSALAEQTSTNPSTNSPTAVTATTADPLTSGEADLRKAQATYYAAYVAAVAKPGNKAAVSRLLDVYQAGSPGRRGMASYVKRLADNGFAARSGPQGYFVIQNVSVTSVADGAPASATVCTYDDGITYDAKHKGPGGKPITVDDSISSAQTRFRYIHQAGTWKLVGGDVLKTWMGEDHCSSKS